MTSFRDVVAFLERRDRRLRGASASVWPILAAAGLAFAWVGVSTFSPFELAAFWAWLPVGAGVAGALAAYVAVARTPRPRQRLLFEVDVRLALDARLSSLQAMDERGTPKPFADRVFRDVLAIHPNWNRALPVPRRLILLAALALILLASALVVPLVAPGSPTPAPPLAAPPSGTPSGPASAAAESLDGAGVDETPTSSAPPAVAPVSRAAARSQRTLSEILSELRPALAGAPSTSDALGSETSRAELESELARLNTRLGAEGARLTPDDLQTLRSATSSFPDLSTAVENAASTSDLDALRDTISQLLHRGSPGEAPPAPTTRTDVAPTNGGANAEGSSPPLPGSGTAGPAASGTPGQGQGGSGSPPEAQESTEPLFESGVGEVAPVAAPLVVGAVGTASSYITSGVPVEAPADPAATSAAWTLSPTQIQSVLSGRELPADAADTIRDYFQRITEATP